MTDDEAEIARATGMTEDDLEEARREYAKAIAAATAVIGSLSDFAKMSGTDLMLWQTTAGRATIWQPTSRRLAN